MMKSFLALFSIFLSTQSIAAPITCGGAEGEVSFLKSAHPVDDDVETVISASKSGRATVLRFDGRLDFVGMECRNTKAGKPLFVFQAFCGGSSCKDLDNFGIIDPSDLRVLLVPSDNNRGAAKQIMGQDQPPIKNTTSISKIASQLYKRNN